MSRKLLCLTVVILTLAAAGTAQATLSAYDGFNYTAGNSLVGQNGGSGWGGAWASSGGDTTWTAGGTGLTYHDAVNNLDLQVSGGCGIGSSTATNWFTEPRTLGTSISSGTLYLSQLLYFTNDENGKGPHYIALKGTSSAMAYISPAWGGTNYWRLCVRNQSGSDTVSSSTSYYAKAGETHFVVMKIEFDANGVNEKVSMYLDPALNAEPSTPLFSINTVNIGTVGGWEFLLRGSSGNTDTVHADEIRIGTTWADVAPVAVPEPSTIALLASGLVGLLAYAWRKRK